MKPPGNAETAPEIEALKALARDLRMWPTSISRLSSPQPAMLRTPRAPIASNWSSSQRRWPPTTAP